ncbi:MAG: helix-turn-helix domain-containing protein [Clostridia bacterium]|nr:helix-turn-helix domain-containing protein [Clostridia bacterium]
MKDFGLILKKLRKARGLNQEELANALGVRKTTISNYETGYSTPPSTMMRQIAEFFSVSTSELFGETVPMQEPFATNDVTSKNVPVYACLVGSLENSLPLYQLQLPNVLMGEGNFFALQIADDRMDRAGMPDGSIAIIRLQEFADNGDIVVTSVDGDSAIIARLYRSGASVTLVAESSNAAYHPVIVNILEQPVKIFGKVIKVLQSM